MPEWVIRRYEPRDHDGVWRLHREGIEQTTPTYPQVLKGYEDDLANIESTYLGDGSNFWVVETEGLIGMTAIQRVDERTGRLRRMRVTTEWRRRGVARALLEVAMEFCRANGYEKLILDTTEQQVDAHRLYERYGFVRTDDRMLGPFRVFDYEMALDAG